MAFLFLNGTTHEYRQPNLTRANTLKSPLWQMMVHEISFFFDTCKAIRK
jgi:hypothetical protein